MANKKISELTTLLAADAADGDQMEIRDITAADSDANKKITVAEMKSIFGAAATITDNAIVRGDGGGNAIQGSGILIDDSDNITAANSIAFGDEALDTYDEGTFTPTAVSYDGTLTIANGWYTRIGREVFIYMIFQGDGTVDASPVILASLPFVSTNVAANWEAASFTGRESSGGVLLTYGLINNNVSQVGINLPAAAWTWTAMAGGFNSLAGHYFTDA